MRFSWPWSRAALAGLLVASASSATFAALRAADQLAVVVGALYPLAVAAVFGVPAYVTVRLAPRLQRGLVVPAAAICCVFPMLMLVALTGHRDWVRSLLFLGSFLVVGGLGGLAFWAVRVGKSGSTIQVAFWGSLAVTFLPIAGWFAGWRVPEPRAAWSDKFAWEDAAPNDCPIMARSIREMKLDQLPGRPPLMGKSRLGGPCDWSAAGLSLERVTYAEFRAAAESKPPTEYIEHIGISRPSYSLLKLRARVEVSHFYGWEGGDGFYCTFHRHFTGWKFVACERGWIS